MLVTWYQHLPSQLSPIAFVIGNFSIRWYGIAYVVGFGVVYFLLDWRMKKGEIDNIYQISNLVTDYLLVTFFVALLGGRLGYVLFYNAAYFWTNPWQIISPFDQRGNLIGLYGMSYHGALLGVLLGSWAYLKIKKLNFLVWADFVVPAVPLGYFFGRIGNFLNGELYGRATSSAWGMYFTNSSSSMQLRHPSQLYEALGEGLLLFLVLWNIRNRNCKKGTLLLIYLASYGLVRFLLEQFRQPDPQLGLYFGLLTMGQLLSATMVLVTLGWSVILKNAKKCYNE